MRVLLCRPLADGEATAKRLRAMGHEPVLAPVLAIATLAIMLPAGPIDGLIVTSRHALPALEGAEATGLRDLPLFAVGEASARAARAMAFRDIRIGQGDAAGLADLVTLTLPAKARLLYLAGEVRKETLPEALRRRGYALHIREAYAARPCGPWPASVIHALLSRQIDACLHFSRRSAELALATSAAGGASDAFGAMHHCCLSADAAAPLHARGLSATIAAQPSENSLMQVLASILH